MIWIDFFIFTAEKSAIIPIMVCENNKSIAGKLISSLHKCFNYLIWPAACLNCKNTITEAEKYLCNECWQGLLECTSGDYCPSCGKNVSRYAVLDNKCPDCQSKSFHFDQIARCGIYIGIMQQLILKFKHDKTELDYLFSSLLNSALQSSGFYDKVDFFVPVPLHWLKRIKRGYNQAELAAKKLTHKSAELSKELVRIRPTKSQPYMTTPAQRFVNVANAFTVRKNHSYKNKNICLIDDIKTSGATLNECARILKEHDAAKVYALVLAVADQKDALKY